MTSPRRLDELREDARYKHERRGLYRAKVHSSRPTSPARLRELERAAGLADSRLRRAEREERAEEDREPL